MKRPLTLAPYIVITLVVIFLDSVGILHGLKTATDVVVVPVKQSLYRGSIALSQFPAILLHYHELSAMRDQLQQLQITTYTQKEEIAKLQAENTRLRAQLDAPLPSSFQQLPATILGVSRFMDISVGTRDRVRRGMPIVVGTVLVGTIAETGERRSSVMLLTDTQLTLPAITSRGTKGIVTGQFGQGSTLTKVLQKDALFLGDTVYTQSSDFIPADLTIGTVSHVSVTDAAVYKQAKVSLPADWRTVRTVFVIVQL